MEGVIYPPLFRRMGESLIIYEDGEQTRHLILVSDAVRAMMLTLTRGDLKGETFNIAIGGFRHP